MTGDGVAGVGAGAAGGAPRRAGPRAWGLRPSASDPSHPAGAAEEVQENPGQLLRTAKTTPLIRVP